MPTGIWLICYFGLWCGLLINTLVLLALARQIVALHSYWVRNDPDWGLPLGSLAPSLRGADLPGGPIRGFSETGGRTILFFLSAGCHSCRLVPSLLPALSRIEGLRPILILSGKPTAAKVFLAETMRSDLPPKPAVILDTDGRLAREYKVTAVPYAVVVDAGGRVGAKGSPGTLGEIAFLINQADRFGERPRTPETSDEVPAGAPAGNAPTVGAPAVRVH